MVNATIHGIIGYTVTPFEATSDQLDLGALGRTIDRMIEGGVHAIAPLGSTGEGAYLNDREWDLVCEHSLQHVAKRVPTIVSVSDLTTASAVRRARYAQGHGADAVMVLPVSYWKLSEPEIRQHYQAIGDSIDIPIMLYNNPATSGTDMSVELILDICRTVPNVTMVKESTGQIERMHRLHELSQGEVPFYNGCNPLALEAFKAGASGWCTAAPNLIPQLTCQLYQAMRSGDLDKAQALFDQQLPLLSFILKGGLPATVKSGLALTGLVVGDPRLPVQPLDDQAERQLWDLLSELR